MRHSLRSTAALLIGAVASTALAQSAPPPALTSAPAPSEIVAAAPAADWVAIPADDLLVMTLAPDAAGHARRVVIQLMPAPEGQPWVANIRRLVAAHWFDGLSVNRVQDNYVVQWGDGDEDDPAHARPLPDGLSATSEAGYSRPLTVTEARALRAARAGRSVRNPTIITDDPYARGGASFVTHGWPMASDGRSAWPVHCYGMVGVGRGLSPDAGSGAELYTVIGHAPRHLDRNIAVVGRVIEGIENLSSLPRGTEALGVYATPAERTRILSITLASDLPAAERPRFEYLSTESNAFARYAAARANRHDAFFIRPAGGADICNIAAPVRRVLAGR